MHAPRSLVSALRPAVAALTLSGIATVHAGTIVVNDVGDAQANDGFCTLREAVIAANTNAASGAAAGECAAGQALPTVDTIAFAIPGSGVHTIAVLSTLPVITQAVVIDGYTQSGSSVNTLAVGDDAVLHVEIDGTGMSPGSDLFRIMSDGSTLTGLVMNHVSGTSIFVGFSTFSNNANVISGNFIGTDAAGSTFAGGTQTVVRVAGAANTIGGAAPAARNVIVGGGGSNAGTVMISGSANVLRGNYIGVDISGNTALQPANATNGLELGPGGAATGTLVGGSNPGEGNVIFGSNNCIRLSSGVHDTIIQGNHLGIDAAGSGRLGANVGISTDNGPDHTTIGGAAPGAGNVISGANVGIFLGDGASALIIKGNRIGTDATGTKPVPNLGDGISIVVPGTGSIIGGTAPGEGNTIAYNCGFGIGIFQADSFLAWAMLGNSIHSNRNLGISLTHSNTPLANDAGDLDSGSNNSQNHPVIAAAPIAAGIVDIAGSLNSQPNETYRVEFFSGPGCHPSGSGEGRHFLGAIDSLTDGNGNASFGGGTAQFAVPAGHSVFTSTATDPAGNTSEFSQCFGVPELLFHDDFEGSCSGYD